MRSGLWLIKKPKLSDFFGALPGVFGAGLKYQKEVRIAKKTTYFEAEVSTI
ncbi:hypothetical protein [Pedobacter psychroterrae]|uniref:hypothetical protein n=1 Tax=Pedobacter psychroterrae TaxID=2530453 RepID=UPI0013F14685|nr:hypothetical protein [Pedobacter psychroterrae]